MSKLLSAIIAATFAAVSVNALAASHAAAQGKDDKGMAKKEAAAPKKEEAKKDAAAPKAEAKKEEAKKDAAPAKKEEKKDAKK